MLKLLVHIDTKVLLSDERETLILCNQDIESLSDWLHRNYDVKVIKTDISTLENIVIVFAIKDKYFEGRTVSIAKAISHLDPAEEDVKKYLYDLNAKGNIKLQYGIRDNKVIHISEISVNERGLLCNCYCPGCGEKLIARLGEKKQKHFSHCGEHCNIAVAQQTALHMMAKEIIEEELSLFVPGIRVALEEIYNNYGDEFFWKLQKEYEYIQDTKVRFDSVELEKKITDIIPDIVVYKDGRPCLIEIAVTHFVDDSKRLKVKQLDIPMFEIDISGLYGSAFSKEKLREAIIFQKDNKRWIHNPKYETALNKAKEYYSQKYIELKREESRKKEELRKKELIREKNIRFAQNKITELLKPGNYKNKLISLRNDEAFEEYYKTLYFRKDIKEGYPFFIDLPIKGEVIFNCDRRIWQGAIFDRFVYCRRPINEKKSLISYENIKRWFKGNQNVIVINQGINLMVKIDGEEKAFLYDVIMKYLDYLSYLGFLYDFENKKHLFRVEVSGSVIPPKSTEAKKLENIMKKVDVYSPNIDSEVKALLYPLDFVEPHKESENPYNCESIVCNFSDIKYRYMSVGKIDLSRGFRSIRNKDFTLEEPVYDSFGTRWVKCTLCGKIKPSHLMGFYKFGLGECTKCSEDAF